MGPITLLDSRQAFPMIRVVFLSIAIAVAPFAMSAQNSENTDLSGFGGQTGLGFTFGDGLGPVFRYCLNQKPALNVLRTVEPVFDPASGETIQPERFNRLLNFSVGYMHPLEYVWRPLLEIKSGNFLMR